MDRDALQQLLAPLLPGLMGMRLVEVSLTKVVAEMEVRP